MRNDETASPFIHHSSFRIHHFFSSWSRAETRQSNFQTVSLMTSTNPHGIKSKDEGGRMKDESTAVENRLSLHPSAFILHPCFSKSSSHSVWIAPAPGLSTRSYVCEPKKSRCACVRLSGSSAVR